MQTVDPIADLAVRRRQLEAHLLRSHDYQDKAIWRMRVLGIVAAVSLVLFFGESLLYYREPKPVPSPVMAAMDVTTLVLLLSMALLYRARRCLRRLNERWLAPDAKKALETLRLEQTRLHGSG